MSTKKQEGRLHEALARLQAAVAAAWQVAIGAHRVVPSEGVQLDADGQTQVPDIGVLVTLPGTYTIETLHNGEVLDSIDLTFDAPASMRLSTMSGAARAHSRGTWKAPPSLPPNPRRARQCSRTAGSPRRS